MHGATEHLCLGCLQALLEGISELTACKGILERHLAVADAGLAELALSIPLMQVTQISYKHISHSQKAMRWYDRARAKF